MNKKIRALRIFISFIWILVVTLPQINAQSITVDKKSGFYTDSVIVNVQTFPDTLKVYYTLNGSIPDTSNLLNADSLVLYETSVLRLASYSPDYTDTSEIFKTFFINESTELSVLAITTDPDNLFSDERGIYVEGTNGIPGYCN